MFPCFGTILYVHFRNAREGKSTPGVGNSCAPHPLNKSLRIFRFFKIIIILCKKFDDLNENLCVHSHNVLCFNMIMNETPESSTFCRGRFFYMYTKFVYVSPT